MQLRCSTCERTEIVEDDDGPRELVAACLGCDRSIDLGGPGGLLDARHGLPAPPALSPGWTVARLGVRVVVGDADYRQPARADDEVLELRSPPGLCERSWQRVAVATSAGMLGLCVGAALGAATMSSAGVPLAAAALVLRSRRVVIRARRGELLLAWQTLGRLHHVERIPTGWMRALRVAHDGDEALLGAVDADDEVRPLLRIGSPGDADALAALLGAHLRLAGA
jgi:hypothetical protein